MTTIITKNGSGAPTAGQLSEGELAVDLTNKELYTKSGSTVIKIGGTGGGETGTFTDLTATSSFTSPGIDDNATSTAITIDASENVGIGTSDPNANLEVQGTSAPGVIRASSSDDSIVGDQEVGRFETYTIDPSGGGAGVASYMSGISESVVGSQYGIEFGTKGPADSNAVGRVRISNTGNVGIGTDAPRRKLEVADTGAAIISLQSTDSDNCQIFFGDAESETVGKILYRHNTNSMSFETLAGERMRISHLGNVGIGQDDPSAPLTVDGPSNDTYVARFGNFAGGGGSIQGRTDIGLDFWATENGTHPAAAVGVEQVSTDQYRGGLLFSTRGTNSDVAPVERMRISSLGNVGINNNAPVDKFDVKASGDDERLVRISHPSSPTAAAGYFGFTDTGSGANTGVALGVQYAGGYYDALTIDRETRNVGIGTTSPSAIISSSKIAQVASTGNTTLSVTSTDSVNDRSAIVELLSSGNGNSKSIILYGDTDTSPSTPSPLVFQGYHSGARTERMRLDASGNLLVGRTTQVVGGKISVDYQNGVDAGIALKDTQTTGTGVPMQVVNGAGSVVGSITHDQSNTSFNTSSDERLKENIVDAPSGNIDGICVRSFDWKASGAHQTYGMIAQELVRVAPEAVTKETAGNDMWSIDYSKLVPMMIKEIQDLKAEVAALKGA